MLDLPWADWAVCLRLDVRKFRCMNAGCLRQVFCERLPSVVAPWGRRTDRLRERQRHVGMTLGGAAGERVSRHLDCETSRHTLLRLIRSAPERTPATPKVLGVDDWATCKGQTYGTILVDLEAGEVVDLLPDRDAQTLAEWLRGHPGVEVIARDRADAYATGAREGAPTALQVADRFHLVHNLIDVLQQVFERHGTLLKLPDPDPAPAASPDGTAVPEQGEGAQEEASFTPLDPVLTPKGQLRRAQYAEARMLHEQGWTKSAIARHLGIRRHTVRRYVEAETFPDRRHSRSKLGSLQAVPR